MAFAILQKALFKRLFDFFILFTSAWRFLTKFKLAGGAGSYGLIDPVRYRAAV
jgi:hypothetical protein